MLNVTPVLCCRVAAQSKYVARFPGPLAQAITSCAFGALIGALHHGRATLFSLFAGDISAFPKSSAPLEAKLETINTLSNYCCSDSALRHRTYGRFPSARSE